MRYIAFDGNTEHKFKSIVAAVMFCYGHDKCYVQTKHNIYNFDIASFTYVRDVVDCVYDAFFAAWISIFMTRSERDKFIKVLRGDKKCL